MPSEKKRGRPRKLHPPPPPSPAISRRSSRRPHFNHPKDFYNVDDLVEDDYYDNPALETPELEEDEEDERSRKKKVKLLLKINHRPVQEEEEEEEEEEDGYVSPSPPDESRQVDGSGSSCSYSGGETPLPDTNTLIIILNKIQKKDKYSVFAEPVGPDELPDYHEVIKHPMDFGTIRKKLARNSYTNLEQFEDDVFLVCSNAMQYNAPETIYFKQAQSMQELARKKFQHVRAKRIYAENVHKCPYQMKQDSIADKLIEKSMCLDMLELGRKAFQRPRSGALETTRKPEQQVNQSKLGSEQHQSQSKPIICKSMEKPMYRSPQEFGRPKFSRVGNNNPKDCRKPEQPIISPKKPEKPINQPKPVTDKPIERLTSSSIQELGRKLLRPKTKGPEIVQKLDQLVKLPNSDADKQLHRSMCRSPSVQVGSDTSSGVILTSNGNADPEIKNTEHAGEDRSCDIFSASIPVPPDTLEKTEPSEKEMDISSAAGQKMIPLDENRRETYNTSNEQPSFQPDSLFTVFDGEKQLIAVGPHDESSYARSVARFSATLGPTAWKIASEKIGKALPAGVKFGPGWVGEYEPPLIPIFSLENRFQFTKHYVKSIHDGESRKCRDSNVNFKAKEDIINKRNQVPSIASSQPTEVSNRVPNNIHDGFRSKGTEAKQALFGFPLGHQPQVSNNMFQQKIESSVKKFASETVLTNATGQTTAFRNGATDIPSAMSRHSSEVVTSKFMEMGSIDRSYKKSIPNRELQSQISAIGSKHSGMEGGGFPQAHDFKNLNDIEQSAPLNFISFNQTGRMVKPSPSESINQKVDDPVRLIKMLSGKVPNNLNHPSASCSPCGNQFTSVMSPRKHTDVALPASAQTWMPIATSTEQKHAEVSRSSEAQVGASVTNKPTWMTSNSISGFHGIDNRIPVSQFLPRTEEVMSPSHRGIAFPQGFTPELSRFHVQSSWQGHVSHTPKRQSKNMLPPDLNISFQSPGSPVQQSAKILVDSQQPDLALQL